MNRDDSDNSQQNADHLHICDPYAFNERVGKVVITSGDRIVYCSEVGQPLWEYGQLEAITSAEHRPHYLGTYSGYQVFSLELSADELEQFSPQVVGLRSYLGIVPDGLFRLLGRAVQINDWYRGHRYCGYCGAATSLVTGERAMACNHCHKIYYPRLAPCVMALVTRGDQCLLARNGKWQQSMYSVLAGFIEPGETVESALQREVMEEVGLKVGNHEYIGSQPWPFPGQLMLGFFADYLHGDIQVDGVEISEAHWFHFTELPQIPGEFSLSGQLIRTFVERCKGIN